MNKIERKRTKIANLKEGVQNNLNQIDKEMKIKQGKSSINFNKYI